MSYIKTGSSKKGLVLNLWIDYLMEGRTTVDLAVLKNRNSGSSAQSEFLEVKNNIRNGLGPSLYPVGTSFTVPHATYGDLVFDVAGHNHHKKPGDNNAPTMTLVMHSAIPGIPFEIREAAYAVAADRYPDGLPAGRYKFDLKSKVGNSMNLKSFSFRTTKTVPVGGQILVALWGSDTAHESQYEDISSRCHINTYASPDALTAIESEIAIGMSTSGLITSLGALVVNGLPNGYINTLQRARTGNNSWKESHVRQWLNSRTPSGQWWKQTNAFGRKDLPFSEADGFLKGLDSGFLKSIGFVDVVTRTNHIYENDGQQGDNTYTTHDRMFLLSYDEVGFGTDDVAQGTVLDMFDGAEDSERIRYSIMEPTTKLSWFLRSPYPSETNQVQAVSTSGTASYTKAANTAYGNTSFGIVPACVVY